MSSANESSTPPKKGAVVELRGLVAKPELNGRSGVVVSKYDAKTGRCGIRLNDGSGVNAKLSNIVILSADLKLERALAKLKEAGGTEEDPDDGSDNEDNEDCTDPGEYLDELLAVGDARYELGQYDKAGGIYYRAYHATIHKGSMMNCPESFPVAHKMIQAWAKSDDKHHLKMAHGMAQQTCMMPGCPQYIRQDMKDAERAMTRKGMEVEDLMGSLRNNMASIGMGGMGIP